MEKIPSVIENVLQVLADKFGTTGAFLWKAILKQQIIDGVMEIVYMLIGSAISIFALNRGLNFVYEKFSNNDFGPFFWYVLAIISLGCAVGSLGSAISNLINPEYSALKDILSKIKE